MKTITSVFYCLCFKLPILFGVAFHNHITKNKQFFVNATKTHVCLLFLI